MMTLTGKRPREPESPLGSVWSVGSSEAPDHDETQTTTPSVTDFASESGSLLSTAGCREDEECYPCQEEGCNEPTNGFSQLCPRCKLRGGFFPEDDCSSEEVEEEEFYPCQGDGCNEPTNGFSQLCPRCKLRGGFFPQEWVYVDERES